MLISTNSNTAKVGLYVILAGLGLQTLSLAFYILLVYHAYSSLKRDGIKPFAQPWGMILKTLFFTSALLLLRCTYRTVEFGQGLGHGYLATHEVFFYVFDSLPLLIGISTYAIYWPTQYLLPSPANTPSEEMSVVNPQYNV